MSRPDLGRAFRRWLEQAGGVGSVDDVRRLPPADEIAKLQAEIQAERAERRALQADVERLGAHVLRYDLMPLDFEGGAVDCAIALLTYQARSTGPAWPSLRNLDLDEAERAIAEIERRCAAWRTLLSAAREVAA